MKQQKRKQVKYRAVISTFITATENVYFSRRDTSWLNIPFKHQSYCTTWLCILFQIQSYWNALAKRIKVNREISRNIRPSLTRGVLAEQNK